MPNNEAIEKLEEVKSQLLQILENDMHGQVKVDFPLMIDNVVHNIDDMIEEIAQRN